MKSQITLTKERITPGKGYFFRASLHGKEITTAPTAELATEKAYKMLADAFEYHDSPCTVRTANDGTVLILRFIGDGIAQSEFNRKGKSSGISMGRMTNGYTTFKTLDEYADYLFSQYQSAIA